ncbi:hypothetical protein [Puniceibacterium sp. IMCC21224]|uniref:hypothetical protein n=1 Tax=Puniceibacterium sp. IMCC21224 TaxID=1618204 RepID=UPI00065D01AC|nr:hypothetical protein [Puniceibacterium sp. IMCC21224]KMK63784.1 hypothetical protein IMCC21224_1919 [Puniceibacterium sp. IMCC21224]
MTDRTETNRDRVRRLLITPLDDLGYQRPAGIKDAPWQAERVKLCDDLTYLSDDSLRVLCQMLRTKGQGKRRGEWLRRGPILSFAQIVQARPVEEMPNLVSWFRSVEGPRAERQGVLVNEFEFFARHHRPPLNDGEHRKIAESAQRDVRLVQLAQEGRVLDAEDSARLQHCLTSALLGQI